LAHALLWYSRKPGEANKSLNQDGDEKMKEKMKESLLMSFPQLKTHQLVTTTLNTFLLSYANFTEKIHLPGSAVVLLPVQRAFLSRSVQLLT